MRARDNCLYLSLSMTGKLWNGKLITEIVEICLARRHQRQRWQLASLPLLLVLLLPYSCSAFCCHCCLACAMTSAAVNQSCQVAVEVAAGVGKHRGNPHMNLPAARLHSQFRVRSSQFAVAICQFPVPLRIASSSSDFCSRKCSAG